MNAPQTNPISSSFSQSESLLARNKLSTYTQLQELAGPSRLCELPPDLLSAICREASLHSEATRSHIAGSCKALMHALLGSKGARLTLDVTSVNLAR